MITTPQTATVSDEAVQVAIDEYYPAFTPSESAHDDMRRALTAALPHLALSAAPCSVEVKKLSWVESDDNWWASECGEYAVRKSDLGVVRSRFPNEEWDTFDGTIDEAKAAAQTHRDKYILSQIVTKPVDVAAGLEQAAKFIDQRIAEYVQEHGVTDPETGTVEFPGWGDEYVGELEELSDAIRSLSPAEPVDQWQPTHKHAKRGTEYQLIGAGKMQAENWAEIDKRDNVLITADDQEVAIYRGEDGQHWVRPVAEFNDGRFEALPAAPTSKGGE